MNLITNQRPPNSSFDRSAVTAEISAIMGEIFRIDNVNADESFFDIAPHSLDVIRFFTEVETRLEVTVSLADALVTPTLNGLVSILCGSVNATATADVSRTAPAAPPPMTSRAEVGGQRQSGAELVTLQTNGSLRSMFMVPGGGGNILVFQNLIRYFRNRPLHAFTPRQWDKRGAPYSSLEEMAEEYVGMMKRIQSSGPYNLVGYCFGGLVVYEMARLLMRAGDRVSLLALIDTDAPVNNRPALQSASQQRSGLMRHLRNLSSGGTGYKIKYLTERVQNQTRKFKHAFQRRYFRLLLSVGHNLSPAMMEQAIMYSDDDLTRKYRPGGYGGPIELFWTEKDPVWAGTTRTRRLFDPEVALEGWNSLTGNEVSYHELPGDHVSLLQPPNIDVFAHGLLGLLGPTDQNHNKVTDNSVTLAGVSVR